MDWARLTGETLRFWTCGLRPDSARLVDARGAAGHIEEVIIGRIVVIDEARRARDGLLGVVVGGGWGVDWQKISGLCAARDVQA